MNGTSNMKLYLTLQARSQNEDMRMRMGKIFDLANIGTLSPVPSETELNVQVSDNHMWPGTTEWVESCISLKSLYYFTLFVAVLA